VLAVLRNEAAAPADLRDRAVLLAGRIIELAQRAPLNSGAELAAQVIADGRAWTKFQAIAEAQGGLREPPVAPQQHVLTATRPGEVAAIDNRHLARVAKLAGAPADAAAGLDLHVRIGAVVEKGQPLFTIHAQSLGELRYALDYAGVHPDIVAFGAAE